MEGTWHLYRPDDALAAARPRGPRRPAHRRSGPAVGFALGIVEVVARAEEDQVVGHLGPDLLGPDWDEDEALRRLLADPDRAVGDALLDQRNLAGIGNMYKSELCFLAGVQPLAPGRRGPGPAPAGAPGQAGAGGQQGAGRADHDRRPAARPAALGLPPRQAALPPVRHPDPGADAGPGGPGARDVLVPRLPAVSASSGPVRD